MPLSRRWTLTRYLIEERRRFPDASGQLNALLLDVSLACKAGLSMTGPMQEFICKGPFPEVAKLARPVVHEVLVISERTSAGSCEAIDRLSRSSLARKRRLSSSSLPSCIRNAPRAPWKSPPTLQVSRMKHHASSSRV